MHRTELDPTMDFTTKITKDTKREMLFQSHLRDLRALRGEGSGKSGLRPRSGADHPA
jgi:hypothetical protein